MSGYFSVKSKSAVLVMRNKAMQCTVKKVSETSAKLQVPSTVGIPESFDLVVDGIRRPCRATWTSETEIGFDFEWAKS
jgi:hypothetical protein